MRRSILIACLLVGIARLVNADTGYDLKHEIAWARSTFRRDLRGVRFESPTAKLLDWVKPGASVEVWAFSPAHECARLELRRSTEPRSTNPVYDGLLVGKEIVEQQIRNGRQARSYQVFSIGYLFERDSEGVHWEERDAQGQWQGVGSSGTIGQESAPYGALSHVDAEVARFGGTDLTLYARCAGPIKRVKCQGGGERRCVGCQELEVTPEPAEASYPEGGVGRRYPACNEPCPPTPPSSALARLNELQSRAPIWQPSGETRADTPSLHRTLEGCLRTHHLEVPSLPLGADFR